MYSIKESWIPIFEKINISQILDKINFYDNKIGYSNLNENRSDFNSFEEKSSYYINPKSDKISVSSRLINENIVSNII